MPPRKALWALYPSYNNLYRDEATTSMTAEIDMLVAQMEKLITKHHRTLEREDKLSENLTPKIDIELNLLR